MATITANELRDELKEFHGGDTMYHHSLNRKFWYSAGVRHMAQKAGAYWLLDIIASVINKYRDAPIRTVRFVKDPKTNHWRLTIMNNEGGAILYRQSGTNTNFPFETISFPCNINETADGEMVSIMCLYSED